ncbi:MAG: helix-turn-helix transcriptional regulator [Clostridia bacterium]|nr:helix-turn-helix transcriptional regulator [Clostridia bacterium]
MEQEELNGIIAENLAKYRKSANLTQLELAERLNYSDKSVSKWEQGNGMPDVFVLHKLAELYGVTVNDFLYRHEKEVAVPDKGKRFFNRLMILIMSVGLCWLVAVVAFVFIRLVATDFAYAWLTFIYALPVTFIVSLVLSSVWKLYPWREISVSALIWTLLLAICLTVTSAAQGMENAFMLFFIGIPLQILVVLWFVFRRKAHKKNNP